ncbi:MAG TPA: hypothetical protein VGD58_16215 [Herpetosiphonaceae bacterium]
MSGDTSPHDAAAETIRCRICNRLDRQVTVTPWKGNPVPIDSNTARMFLLIPGTNVRVQRSGSSINIRLFGDPTGISYELQTSVELALTADMSLDVGTQDLMQITLIQPLYHTDSTQIVKCGEGSDASTR